jgi:hypothetical protein
VSEVDCRLSGRVSPAHDDHVLAAGALRVGRHGGVVDAGPAEAIHALGLELAPARAGGHDNRAREHVLAVVEVDAHQALGPVGQLDGAVKAREDGVEAACLQRGVAGQLRARDAAREAQVVLDPGARSRLAAVFPVIRASGVSVVVGLEL